MGWGLEHPGKGGEARWLGGVREGKGDVREVGRSQITQGALG